MDVVNSLKQALGIVQLQARTVSDVAKSRDATWVAFAIMAIAAVLGWLGGAGYGQGIVSAIIGSAVGLLIWTGIVWIVALMFGGKAGYMSLLRPTGYGALVMWLNVLQGVPALGKVIGLAVLVWAVIVEIVVVKSVYNFPTGKAAAVVLIPVAILLLLFFVLFAAMFAALGVMKGGLPIA